MTFIIINLRSNLSLRQCLAFADLLWRFCLIFTPGRVWLMIVTVFSSCHTQIYINITHSAPSWSLHHDFCICIQILINETRQPVFSSSMHPHCQTEYHNLAIFPRSAISIGSITILLYNETALYAVYFPPKSASSQYWLNLGAGVPLWHW